MEESGSVRQQKRQMINESSEILDLKLRLSQNNIEESVSLASYRYN